MKTLDTVRFKLKESRTGAAATRGTLAVGLEPLLHVNRVTAVTAVQADGGQALNGHVAECTDGPFSAMSTERSRRSVAFCRQIFVAIDTDSSDVYRAEIIFLRIVTSSSCRNAFVHFCTLR